MKKNYFWLLAVMLVFMACSNENESGVLPDTGSLKGQLTFTFPMSKGVTTYADTIATSAENSFSTADMAVYMFDASGIVEKVFNGADITGGITGTNTTATISIPGDAAGDKSFYFVANTTTAGSNLSGIAAGSKLSDFLALTTVGQVEHLSSSSGLLLTGSVKVDAASISGGGSASVSLARRVARFDVSNDSDSSLMVIKEVLFYKVKLSGYIFEGNSPSIPSGVATGSLPKIDFTSVSGANTGDCPSVFYLYPSDSVVIQLLAELNGVEQLYTLPLPTGGIQANKRYTVKTKSVIGHEFELIAADWDDDEELVSALDGEISVISISSSAVTGWDASAYRYDASSVGTTITMDISTQSSNGVYYEVTGAPDGYNVTVNYNTPILTYAGVSYRQQVTVTVPQYTGTDPMETTIAIKSRTDSSRSEIITVYSAGTGI